MAEYFSRSFTASDGSTWGADSTGLWSRVFGSAFDALIYSNVGQAGASAAERGYRASGSVPTPDYKASADFVWKNAAGAGRVHGILLRISRDGDDAYSFEIDSNTGTTRARIRRRVGGSFADVVSWTTIGSVSSANLEAGVTVEARCQNQDGDEVALELFVQGSSILSTTDTNAAAILQGGGVGIYLGPNCLTDDVTTDNLSVSDFEDEATASPTELATGTALVVDSIHYSFAELEANRVRVERIRLSYGDDAPAEIADALRFENDSGILYTGAFVKLAIDGNVAASGRVRAVQTNVSPGEGHTFELAPPYRIAQDVIVSHPTTNAPRVAFNLDDDGDDEYESAKTGQTIGDVITWILDTFDDVEGGLRDQGAYPASGTGYTPAELANLTTEIPNLYVQGDVVRAIESLLAFTEYRLWIDPDTLEWHFYERNAGTLTEEDVDAQHVTASLSTDTDLNFTKVQIKGNKRETTQTTFTFDPNDLGGSTLLQGWDSGLESTHDAEKSFKNYDSGTVDTIGTSGGKVTMTPASPFSMVANEWNGCRVRFLDGDEAENQYDVEDGDSSDLTFTATSWINGGPANGDAFEIFGNIRNGGRANGYSEVGRRWKLADDSLGIPKDACVRLTVTQGKTRFTTKVFVEDAPEASGGDGQAVSGDLPAIGLINFTSPSTAPDGCDDGNPGDLPDSVQLEAPVFELDDPTVPTLTRPAAGFYGTAYAWDSGKWSGNGTAGKGDPNIQRTLALQVAGFDGSSAHVTAYTAFADAILKIYGPISREAVITKPGLDTTYLGLNRRVKLTSSSRTLEDRLWSDLDVLAVEYDPRANSTTIYAGTQAAGGYDAQSLVRSYEARNAADRLEKAREDLEQILECLQGRHGGGGDTGTPAPTYVPDCFVSTTDAAGNRTTLGDKRDEEVECEYSHPATGGTGSDTACSGVKKPVQDPTRLLANSDDFQDLSKVKGWYPENELGDLGANEYTSADLLCCVIEHISALWKYNYQLATALNHNHYQNDQEFQQIFLIIQQLETNDGNLQSCIDDLNNCMANKQDATMQTKCWATSTALKCPVVTSSYLPPCADYNTITPPTVDCYGA